MEELFNTLLVYVIEQEPNKIIQALKSIQLYQWVALGLITIAGAANGIMDRIQHHYYTMPESWNEQFWNPKESWRNKWKNGDHTQGEKFLFSSTFLVGLTDGWHLMKSIMLSAIALSITLLLTVDLFSSNIVNKVIVFLVVRTLFGIGFRLFYR